MAVEGLPDNNNLYVDPNKIAKQTPPAAKPQENPRVENPNRQNPLEIQAGRESTNLQRGDSLDISFQRVANENTNPSPQQTQANPAPAPDAPERLTRSEPAPAQQQNSQPPIEIREAAREQQAAQSIESAREQSQENSAVQRDDENSSPGTRGDQGLDLLA